MIEYIDAVTEEDNPVAQTSKESQEFPNLTEGLGLATESKESVFDEVELAEVENKNQTRGKAVEWTKIGTYGSEDMFKESEEAKALGMRYNKHQSNVSIKNGSKLTIYWCKMSSKKLGFDCKMKRKVEYQSDGSVCLYSDPNNIMHEDGPVDTKEKFRFTAPQERKMAELLNIDVTPRNIRKQMLSEGLFKEDNMPTSKQFDNKLFTLRKALNQTQSKVTVQELKELIEENSKDPEDNATPFILKSQFLNNQEELRYLSLCFFENLMLSFKTCLHSENINKP